MPGNAPATFRELGANEKVSIVAVAFATEMVEAAKADAAMDTNATNEMKITTDILPTKYLSFLGL
ncbi:MAG: hypothetical protein ACD_70C00003G0002 [uncultured bacterium]|nr:MAG: hypothetical protein ACD_70C00003G0002 [uncultured bacterium]